jgi:hypothetical protein
MAGCRTLNKNLKNSLVNLEMDVRAGCMAGRTDLSDDVAAADAISHTDEVGLVMPVKHGSPVVGFDHDGVAVPAFRATFDHHSVGNCFDLSAVSGSDIGSFMKSELAANRVPPPPNW